MNILVDGRQFCRYSAGITSFLQGAFLEMARQWQSSTFYVFLPRALDPRSALQSQPNNIHFLDYSKSLLSYLPNIISLQTFIPRLCRKLNIDLYFAPVPHIPAFLPSRVKTLVIAHDIVHILFPETMLFTNRLATKIFFSQAIRKANYLWCISQYTKSEIEKYYHTCRNSDIFVGAAVNREQYNLNEILSKQELESESIPKDVISSPYILFVGSLEPRKNLAFLLSLVPKLYNEHGIKLVVVGANKWKDSNIATIVGSKGFPSEAIFFCPYISNADLAHLYHNAACFVSASLNEGFGMPLLEALLCGCPIVTAHNSAMVEVASGKEGAFTVKGYDSDIWIKTITKVTQTHPVVNQSQLEEYDWEKVINRLTDYLQIQK